MELQVLSGPEVALLSAEEKKKYETYLVEAQRALNLSPKELEKDEEENVLPPEEDTETPAFIRRSLNKNQ